MCSSDVIIPLLCSLLTGGFLLLFIENQNVEKDVSDRYLRLMKPFYHKLTKFIHFAYEVNCAIRYKDKEGEYVPQLKAISDRFDRLEMDCAFNGGDITIMKAGKIESICNDINRLWAFYDKGWIVTENITLDEDERYETRIKMAMSDFPRKFRDLPYDKNLLPTIAGNFYAEEWLPVQNHTGNYESWQRKSKKCNYIVLSSIIATMATLLIVLFLGELLNLFVIKTQVSQVI